LTSRSRRRRSAIPFKSKAQQKYLFSQHPQIAKRWAAHTKDIKSLPEKVSDKKKEAREIIVEACKGLVAQGIEKAAVCRCVANLSMAAIEQHKTAGFLSGLGSIGKGLWSGVKGLGQIFGGTGQAIGGGAKMLSPVAKGVGRAGSWTVDQLRKATGLSQLAGEKALSTAAKASPAMGQDPAAVLDWLKARGHKFTGGMGSWMLDPLGQATAKMTQGGKLRKFTEQAGNPEKFQQMFHNAPTDVTEAARRLMSTHKVPFKGQDLALPEFMRRHQSGMLGLGPVALMSAPAIGYTALGGGETPEVLGGTKAAPEEPSWTQQLTSPIANLSEGLSPGLAKWIRENPGYATAILGALTTAGGYGAYRMLGGGND